MVVTTKTMTHAQQQTRVWVSSTVRRPYAQAIGVYLAVRTVGVAVLAVMSAHNHQPLLDRLTAWDGQWYLELAELGYQGVGATGRAVDSAGHPLWRRLKRR
jgi:hypothetical protein